MADENPIRKAIDKIEAEIIRRFSGMPNPGERPISCPRCCTIHVPSAPCVPLSKALAHAVSRPPPPARPPALPPPALRLTFDIDAADAKIDEAAARLSELAAELAKAQASKPVNLAEAEADGLRLERTLEEIAGTAPMSPPRPKPPRGFPEAEIRAAITIAEAALCWVADTNECHFCALDYRPGPDGTPTLFHDPGCPVELLEDALGGTHVRAVESPVVPLLDEYLAKQKPDPNARTLEGVVVCSTCGSVWWWGAEWLTRHIEGGAVPHLFQVCGVCEPGVPMPDGVELVEPQGTSRAQPALRRGRRPLVFPTTQPPRFASRLPGIALAAGAVGPPPGPTQIDRARMLLGPLSEQSDIRRAFDELVAKSELTPVPTDAEIEARRHVAAGSEEGKGKKT